MRDFKVMLAKPYDPERVQSWKEMYVEPKLDGVRVIVIVKGRKAQYFSRNGRELGMFTHLDRSVHTLCDRLRRVNADYDKGVVLDTEAVGMTFGDVSGAIHTKGTVALTCRLHAFHVMPLAGFKAGCDSMSQRARIHELTDALERVVIKGITVTVPQRVLDHKQVMSAHRKYRYEQYEGTMVKNLMVAWHANRSWDWMKIKEVITEEVMVKSIKEGTGKYVGMCGALICDFKGRTVRVSGMTDAQRAEFFKKPKSIIGRLIEVTAQEETESGSLRHPRFARIRDDKE